MAGHLTCFMPQQWRIGLIVILMGYANVGMSAEHGSKGSSSLVDPMRPPATLLEPASPDEDGSASGLQTVVVRRSGGSVAVINGQVVHVGAKVGESQLVAISEAQAELHGPGGKEILRMTPSVSIHYHVAPSPLSAKAVQKKKRGGGKAVSSKSKSNKRS